MYQTYRKSETLILSDFETQAREDLLNDTYFTISCPICGHHIQFIHPFAYVDTKHRFILLVKAKKDVNESDETLYSEDQTSRKRFLFNPSFIAEKIRILEDGFDDRAIEIVKVKLKSKYEKQHVYDLSYHDVDHTTKTIWFVLRTKEKEEYIAVLYNSYETIAKQLLKETSRFVCVDEAWAQAFLLKTKAP